MTKLVGMVLSENTTSTDRGEGVYKYMCAIAHGTNYATLQHFRPTEGAEDHRNSRVAGHVPIEALQWSVIAAVGAHTSVVDRLTAYVGIEDWTWERWKEHVGQQLMTALPTE